MHPKPLIRRPKHAPFLALLGIPVDETGGLVSEGRKRGVELFDGFPGFLGAGDHRTVWELHGEVFRLGHLGVSGWV